MKDNIRVLTVLPEERKAAAAAGVSPDAIEWMRAESCAEARAILAAGMPVDVVVSDLTLEDGNWYCVYQELANRNLSAEMVVVAPRQGLDVSEILAHGVYTVLAQPLEEGELVRTIEEAAARKANGKGPLAVAGV